MCAREAADVMNLLCYESQCECRAHPDPAFMTDERVLQNLLSREERYSPSPSYFGCVQTEVTPDMRRVVADWLLEVTEEQQCQEGVMSLAMNYMDRFLTVCPTKRAHLQLLGSVCLLIASKLREPCPLAANLIVYYSDNSFTTQDLQMWELLVLVKLKWDIAAVTPQDFLHYILRKLPVDASWDLHMIIRHAQTFVVISTRDHSFLVYPPSIIASASLAAALTGLEWTTKTGCSLSELLDQLHNITGIEKDYLESCLRQMEDMVSTTVKAQAAAEGNNTPGPSSSARNVDHAAAIDKVAEHGKAGTPTDVRDVHF